MADYVPPDPEIAEKVRREEAELEAERRRLEPLDPDTLERILRDTSEPATVRLIAFESLAKRLRGLPQFSRALHDVLEDLVDDPDADVAVTAIDYCPLTEAELIDKVRRQLDSDHERVRAAAAIALAKIKDEAILETFRQWFEGDKEGLRNLAINALVTLDTDEARSILESSYERGGRNENDRIALAISLLRLGDTRGLAFLEEVARGGQGRWSVAAATWIRAHDRAKGLQLMRHVLDHGDLEAKRSMVNQIWNFARLPHAFEAEGIDEARAWVEEQLKSRDAGAP